MFRERSASLRGVLAEPTRLKERMAEMIRSGRFRRGFVTGQIRYGSGKMEKRNSESGP